MTHRKNGKYKYPDMALKVIELDRQAVASVQGLMKKRLIFESLKYQNNQHYFALVGPRGVGKSVLLRQLRAETPESIYIDVGTLIKHNHLVSSMGLEKLIIALHEQHRLYSFFLDEVHLLPQFNQMLQNLADNYLLRIICAYPVDTKNSEKVIKRITTMPLSLREYIYFRKNTLLDPLPLEKLVEKRETREQRSLVLISFLHLYGGLYPPVEIDIDTTNKLGVVKNFVNIKESFFEERREYFENIIKKNIYTDIPAINQDVSMKDLALLEKSMTFIGTSPIDDVNVSTLSTALEITKYRAAKMLSLLEQCFLIHRCFPAGKNVSQEPKVLMMPPLSSSLSASG